MSLGARTAVLEHLGRQHHAMVTLLAELVNIDSGSYNKRGVDAVGDRLRACLEAAGILCESFPHEVFGDCIAARLPAAGGAARPIVLMGHRDTVFPDGTAAQRPFRIDGSHAFGPGVADMKSGLVMNTFVLDAFRRFGAPCPLTGLYTSDEEIASPSSRPVIEAEAKAARAVFNAEPGRPSGNLVSRRKGAAFIEFEVTGQAAHSGVAHAQGVSAIEALARKVQRLHRLTDYDLGTTVNVGLIHGGTAVNTVAARAAAAVDVRFPTLNIMEKILGDVRDICRCCEMPGSEARILHEGNFLPLEQDESSRELLAAYSRSAAGLGLRVSGEATGGSADSGFTAALGTPTLCGTGPVGGNAHRDDEWCRIDTIVPRAQALALTILEVAAA
ncbi:MAG: M20 family metallopeptidase [Alphaproteobacteria bacterium]|nr:M20 family metallopeptidase [Alphaproteobacteria bacterium]